MDFSLVSLFFTGIAVGAGIAIGWYVVTLILALIGSS